MVTGGEAEADSGWPARGTQLVRARMRAGLPGFGPCQPVRARPLRLTRKT